MTANAHCIMRHPAKGSPSMPNGGWLMTVNKQPWTDLSVLRACSP
jgi:hypothetical protein